MTDPSDLSELGAIVESLAIALAVPEDDARRSEDEWVELIRGELASAKSAGANNSPIEEQQHWLNAAAQCLLRAINLQRQIG